VKGQIAALTEQTQDLARKASTMAPAGKDGSGNSGKGA
jgi:hypothetical protein